VKPAHEFKSSVIVDGIVIEEEHDLVNKNASHRGVEEHDHSLKVIDVNKPEKETKQRKVRTREEQ